MNTHKLSLFLFYFFLLYHTIYAIIKEHLNNIHIKHMPEDFMFSGMYYFRGFVHALEQPEHSLLQGGSYYGMENFRM